MRVARCRLLRSVRHLHHRPSRRPADGRSIRKGLGANAERKEKAEEGREGRAEGDEARSGFLGVSHWSSVVRLQSGIKL